MLLPFASTRVDGGRAGGGGKRHYILGQVSESHTITDGGKKRTPLSSSYFIRTRLENGERNSVAQ